MPMGRLSAPISISEAILPNSALSWDWPLKVATAWTMLTVTAPESPSPEPVGTSPLSAMYRPLVTP